MNNHINKKNKFEILYKEQNEYLKNRLKKIKSSNYINYPKSLTFSKDKINIKINDKNENKNIKSKK